MDFLYLSEEDMVKAGVLDMPKCIDSMEEAFKLLFIGDYRLGGPNNCDHGLRTRFPKSSQIEGMPLDAPGRWFAAMPAYLGGSYHCFGIKTYGANQDNTKAGLPRSILMMQLLDIETGAPFAFMSANILSAMRTGGVTGLFAKRFANPHAKKVAVIGPGVIGRYSLDAVMCVCPEIEQISIFGRGQKNRDLFYEHCKAHGYPLEGYRDCSTVSEACSDADVIVTANTQAPSFAGYPLIGDGDIKEGACVIAMSAVRIDRSYVAGCDGNCVFVADDMRMYQKDRGIDAAPLNDAERQSITLKGALHEKLSTGEAVLNLPDIVSADSFTRDEKAIYLCASGGIPIEDVAWACECYRSARERGVGSLMPVWNESHL